VAVYHILIPILLFLVGIAGGVIAAVAGGGGLLLIPVFLFTGLTPLQAVATQNLFVVPAGASATWKFWEQRRLSLKDTAVFIPVLFLLGGLGAESIGLLPDPFLKILVPVLLVGVAFWVALNPAMRVGKLARSLDRWQYGLFVLPVLAFYDGFFGTCSGVFYMMSNMAFQNRKAIEATAASKLFATASSSAALLVFAMNGHIMWLYGLAVGLGGIIGAQIGARLVIKHGAGIIRAVVLVTAVAASLKLLIFSQ
jgi:uncharacterized protein